MEHSFGHGAPELVDETRHTQGGMAEDGTRAIPLKNLSSSHLVLAPTNKEMISRLRAQIFNIYLVGWLILIFFNFMLLLLLLLF